MTYLEKLNENLQYIVNRHFDAIERNCSDKVKDFIKQQYNDQKPYIKFIKYQPVEKRTSDFEYLLYEAPYVNVELKNDIESLLYEYGLTITPDYFVSFPCAGVDCAGFMVKIPEGWTNNYKDKEYQEPEPKEESPLYWHDWHCSDENMDKRYKHFNIISEQFIKYFNNNINN